MPVDGRQEAGHQRDQRGLAGAVGAEQAGDAGADGHRHVVDRDDVAVPPRDVVELDRAHAGSPRKRERSGVVSWGGHADLPVAEQHRAERAEDRDRGRGEVEQPHAVPVGGVGGGLGESKRNTCTPLTSVYGENRPATSPTVSWPVSDEMPWMRRHHRVADQQQHDHRRHRQAPADRQRRDQGRQSTARQAASSDRADDARRGSGRSRGRAGRSASSPPTYISSSGARDQHERRHRQRGEPDQDVRRRAPHRAGRGRA